MGPLNTYHPMMGKFFVEESKHLIGICTGVDSDGLPKFAYQYDLNILSPVERRMTKSFDTCRLANQEERRFLSCILKCIYSDENDEIVYGEKTVFEAGTVLRTTDLERNFYFLLIADLCSDRFEDFKIADKIFYCHTNSHVFDWQGSRTRLEPASEEEIVRAMLHFEKRHYESKWGTEDFNNRIIIRE